MGTVRSSPVTFFYVHPGEMVVCDGPALVKTILGSCVAVCLWDTDTHVAGLNHFQLPYAVNNRGPHGRFGRTATSQLINRVVDTGGRRHRLISKVYGGACVLDCMRSQATHLGEQNARVAVQTLNGYRIHIEQTDVGGTRGRKISFLTTDGSVLVEVL